MKGPDGQFYILDSIGRRTIPTYATSMKDAATIAMTLYTRNIPDHVALSWDIMMPVQKPSPREHARLTRWINALNLMHVSHHYTNRIGRDGLHEAGYEDALHDQLRDFLDGEGVPDDTATRVRELTVVHLECLRSMGEMQADIRANQESLDRMNAISSMIETCIERL